MSDVASSLAWCSIGIVDGERKLSMEAMVQQHPCTERCDVGGCSSSLLGLSTARQTLSPHTLQSSCLESKGDDVDLLPDVSTC